jgi:hypothetical protein
MQVSLPALIGSFVCICRSLYIHYFRNFLAPPGSSAECLHSSSCLDSRLRNASHMRGGGGASATHGSIAVFEPRMYVAACGRVCRNSPFVSEGMQVEKQHSHAPACVLDTVDKQVRKCSGMHDTSYVSIRQHTSAYVGSGMHDKSLPPPTSNAGSAADSAHGAASQSLFLHPSIHSTHTFNGLSFANSEWPLPSGSSRCSSISAATTALSSSP